MHIIYWRIESTWNPLVESHVIHFPETINKKARMRTYIWFSIKSIILCYARSRLVPSCACHVLKTCHYSAAAQRNIYTHKIHERKWIALKFKDRTYHIGKLPSIAHYRIRRIQKDCSGFLFSELRWCFSIESNWNGIWCENHRSIELTAISAIKKWFRYWLIAFIFHAKLKSFQFYRNVLSVALFLSHSISA